MLFSERVGTSFAPVRKNATAKDLCVQESLSEPVTVCRWFLYGNDDVCNMSPLSTNANIHRRVACRKMWRKVKCFSLFYSDSNAKMNLMRRIQANGAQCIKRYVPPVSVPKFVS